MNADPNPVRGLAEIALRVRDMEAMVAFYRDVIGLEVMRQEAEMAFFRLAPGHRGHTQILALFDRTQRDPEAPENAKSTVDHLAFSIDIEQYEPQKARLEGLGCDLFTAEHAWVHWRSLFVRDPEGNLVEYVCYDETVV